MINTLELPVAQENLLEQAVAACERGDKVAAPFHQQGGDCAKEGYFA